METGLIGAWEVTSGDEVGLAIFTSHHFCMMATAKERPAFASEEPTDAEAAEAFRTLQAAGGTYEVGDGAIVFHRLVNRHPNLAGRDYRWTYELDGDRLVLGPRTWQRVEGFE